VPAPYQPHTTRPYPTNRTYRQNAGALGADQIDAEHQATDLVAGVSHPRGRLSLSRPTGSRWLQVSRTLLAGATKDDGA
jgi:hypothetical protein